MDLPLCSEIGRKFAAKRGMGYYHSKFLLMVLTLGLQTLFLFPAWGSAGVGDEGVGGLALPPRGSKAAEIEATCRVEAKKAATETYRGCVSEKKSAQLDALKKAYDERLQALKRQYEQELDRVAPARKGAKVRSSDGAKNKSPVNIDGANAQTGPGDRAASAAPGASGNRSAGKVEIQSNDISSDGSMNVPEPIVSEPPSN